jgi:cell division protein FtsB
VVIELVALGVAFWGTVLGGGFYFVRRYVRAVERRAGQEESLAALQARVATLEELIEGMRAEVDRLESGQEFTTRLLADRAKSSSSPS